MWIFTPDGFYSAVQLRDDSTKLLIRARSRDDLVRLGDKIGFNETAIKQIPGSDYKYRAGLEGEIDKTVFGKYLLEETLNIDYDSHCKEVMSKPSGTREADRYAWYMACWTAGVRYEDDRLKPGLRTTGDRQLWLESVQDVLYTDDYLHTDDTLDDSYADGTTFSSFDEWVSRNDNSKIPHVYDSEDLIDPHFLAWCEDNGYFPSDTAMDMFISEQINP